MGILRAECQTRTFTVHTHEANMSDEPTDEETEDIEPDPDLTDEDMEGEIELDMEADAILGEEDSEGDDENKEIPVGARPAADEEEEDEEDDEVEADLDTILKERLSSADDEDEEEEEEEDDDEGVITTAEGDRIPGKQEDEILCEGCFLLVKESQYDMRDNVASCPHCGTLLNV